MNIDADSFLTSKNIGRRRLRFSFPLLSNQEVSRVHGAILLEWSLPVSGL
jgi:hypothetical protein